MKGKRGRKKKTDSTLNTSSNENHQAKYLQTPISSYMLPKSTKNSTFKAESNQSKDNVISGGVVENNCVKIGKGGKSLPSKGSCQIIDRNCCKEVAVNYSDIPLPLPKEKKGASKSKKDSKTSEAKNKKITEFFPNRRSDRKTKKTIQSEKHEEITKILLSEKDPDCLHIYEFEGKGRGVVTSKSCKRGEFVVEYAGELIDPQTAQLRECRYTADENIGCYMYYFTHNDKQYCVDATSESGRLGRLINHSKKDGNLATKTFVVDDVARLILIAKRDIHEEEELLYDYGDRSISSLQHHPWLAK